MSVMSRVQYGKARNKEPGFQEISLLLLAGSLIKDQRRFKVLNLILNPGFLIT